MQHRLNKNRANKTFIIIIIQGRLFMLILVHHIQEDHQGVKKDCTFMLTIMERIRIIVNQIEDLVTISLTSLYRRIINQDNSLALKLNSLKISKLGKFIPMYRYKKRKVTLIGYCN